MKKTFKKRPHLNQEMALQITSMADIFTIILVFLLKGYSTGAIQLTPTQGLFLPEAQAGQATVEALKVEISEKGVQVEGKYVASLQNFSFAPSELEKNGSSKGLGAMLAQERKRQILISKSNSDVKLDPRIIVIADQRAPYSTIKTVLASAAVHGYTDFKLAVLRGD